MHAEGTDRYCCVATLYNLQFTWQPEEQNLIFKKRKMEDWGDYSLTSVPVKALILETISRHFKIMTSHDGISKRKSFLSHLVNFCNEITSLTDKAEAVDIVFPEFSEVLTHYFLYYFINY